LWSVVTTTKMAYSAPSATGLPDDEVVQRVRGGETSLFEVLMRRYNRRLYRVARAILRDDSEAEDVMQHAYVAAFAHLDQYAGRARFSTWLTRIAVYEALARLRRRGREVNADTGSDHGGDAMGRARSSGPDPERQLLQSEIRRLLESAIEGLPDAYRSVFVLREVEGLSTFETAECLAVSADVVKTRLHRARALLRDSLLERDEILSSVYPFPCPRCDRVVNAVFARLSQGVRPWLSRNTLFPATGGAETPYLSSVPSPRRPDGT
jgi:RNA polymerase sigma-70 factor, ECF subfamily